MRRTYGTCTAWAEYPDPAGEADGIEVRVDFDITHPGQKPDPWGDDPGAAPEGEISAVECRQFPGQWSAAPPHIDAWARDPERFAELFEQALASSWSWQSRDPDDARDRAIDDRLMGVR